MGRGPVIFVAGMLLGGAGAAIIVRTAGDGTTPDAADSSVARRLDGIDAELRALGAALADRPVLPPARADVAPSPLTDPRIDEVLAQYARLQASLGELGQKVDAVGVAWADEARRSKASEPMPDALPDAPPNLAAFEALRKRSQEDLTHEHLLWTYEQVGTSFGRPDEVRPSADGVGIKYFYKLPGGESFCFWFVGGKLVGAFWN